MPARFEPSTAFKIPVRFLKLLGFWKYNGSCNILYLFYGQIIYLATTVLFAASMIMNMVHAWGDLAEMADSLYIAITIICTIFKFKLLDPKKMLLIIQTLDSQALNNQTENQDHFIKKAMKNAYKNSLAFTSICVFVCCAWNLIPFVLGTFALKVLPFKAWFPYPYNESPYYEFTCLYQFVGLNINAILNCSIDSMVAGLMIIACAQLQVLKDSLRNVRARALLQLKQSDNGDEFCDNCYNGLCDNELHFTKGNIDLEYGVFRGIIECIEHHQAIIEFVHLIQDTYTKSMFAQFLTSMMVICMTAFELSVLNPFTIPFFATFIYMINMTVQLFIYCWYGNELYLMSTTINEDIYNSEWYRFGPQVSKLLLIMMERSKRPMILTAGKMFQLSLETFTSIIKTAYSCYTVLNKIDVDISLE